MTLAHLPNIISLLRVMLVLPTVWALVHDRYGLALVLFAVCGASDALDGYLAKRYAWTSRLGAILDPLADKTLLVATYVTLAWLGAIPRWLTIAVVGRDLIIVAGALAYHFLIGRFELAPTWLSKANTLMQIVLVMAVMLDRAVPGVPAPVLVSLIYGVLLTTVLSGVDYMIIWGRRAWLVGHRGGPAKSGGG